MRRVVSSVLAGLVVVGMVLPRAADAFLPVKAGGVIAGVAMDKTVQHLERCRKLPAASKGALTQGVNLMRRTPNGWAKAFIGAGALYWAWQQAKSDYIDEESRATPSVSGQASFQPEKGPGYWIVKVKSHPVTGVGVYRITADGDTISLGFLAPGNDVVPYSVNPGDSLRVDGGDPWGTLGTIGPMPLVLEPGQELEDGDQRLDNMTNNPFWRNRFKAKLKEATEEETAVTPNVEVPGAPYVWQKPGTTGEHPDDWESSNPTTPGDYPSPEAQGDTGTGSSVALEPEPEPTAEPSGEPSPEPSGGPSPEPSQQPSPTPTPTLPELPQVGSWWSHLASRLSTKFPFDLIADFHSLPSFGQQDLSIKTFGNVHDLNFVRGWVTAIKWISALGLTILAIMWL